MGNEEIGCNKSQSYGYHMSRILIVDSFSSSNRGDAAILSGLIVSLQTYLHDATYVVHSPFYKTTARFHNVVSKPPLLRNVSSFSRCLREIFSAGRMTIAAVLASRGFPATTLLVSAAQRASYQDYLEADLILGMGGAFYNDNYTAWLPARMFHLWLGKQLGKPVAISAHSFGPFRHHLFKILARIVFSQLDLICVRDSSSLNVLSELKVSGPRIEFVGDTAWLVQGSDKSTGLGILAKEGIVFNDNMPLIVVTGRKWDYYQSVGSGQGHSNYIRVLASVLSRLQREFGARILYASTCTNLDGYQIDDRLVGDEIRSAMETLGGELLVLRGEYSPEELMGVYGLAYMSVCTRMHSIILSATQGIPAVGIAYEQKTFDLMSSLNLAEYVVDIETLSCDRLWDVVAHLLTERNQIVKRLAPAVETLRELALENGQIISSLITGE